MLKRGVVGAILNSWIETVLPPRSLNSFNVACSSGFFDIYPWSIAPWQPQGKALLDSLLIPLASGSCNHSFGADALFCLLYCIKLTPQGIYGPQVGVPPGYANNCKWSRGISEAYSTRHTGDKVEVHYHYVSLKSICVFYTTPQVCNLMLRFMIRQTTCVLWKKLYTQSLIFT